MEEFLVQLTTLLSLLAGSFLVGHLPFLIIWRVSRDQTAYRRNKVVSFLSHLGGGVFMSLCLIILLPESRQHFEQREEAQHLKEEGEAHASHEEGFPIPEFIVLCSFFGTFALQELLHYFLYHFRRKSEKPNPRVRFCSCAKRHTECSRTFKADTPEQTMFGLDKNKYSESKNSGLDEEHSAQNRAHDGATHITAKLLESSMLSHPVPNYGTHSVTNATTQLTNTPVPVPPVMIAGHGNAALNQTQRGSSHYTAATSNILLLIALSFHAILRGMILGSITLVSWPFLLVACVQQTIIVFIMGSVALYSCEKLWPVTGFVTAISTMCPLGIGLAMGLNEEISNVSDLLYGSANAVICGALMYLTFYDLLRRRNIGESPHGLKFVGLTLGAAGMAALQYLLTILR